MRFILLAALAASGPTSTAPTARHHYHLYPGDVVDVAGGPHFDWSCTLFRAGQQPATQSETACSSVAVVRSGLERSPTFSSGSSPPRMDYWFNVATRPFTRRPIGDHSLRTNPSTTCATFPRKLRPKQIGEEQPRWFPA